MPSNAANIWEGPTAITPLLPGTGNMVIEQFIASAGQTIFNLTTFQYVPGSGTLFVFIDGLLQRLTTDYLEVDLDTITLITPLNVGDSVTILGFAINSVTMFSPTFIAAGVGAVLRQMQNKAREHVSLDDYDSSGGTDYLAAFTRAIATGAGVIELPDTQVPYFGAIPIVAPIIFRGKGQGKTILVPLDPAGDGLYFNYNTYLMGGGFEDLSIHAGFANNTGTGSTGTGLKLRKTNGAFSARRFDIRAFAKGGDIGQNFYARLQDFQILYCQDWGLKLPTPGAGTAGAGNVVSKAKISNFGFTGNNAASVGLYLEQSGGDFLDDIDITSFNQPVVLKPTAADTIAYLFARDVLGDTGVSDNWTIDATVGSIAALEFNGCWAGFSTNGDGVKISGPVDGLIWSDGRQRENGKTGFNILGGKNININETQVARNSKLASNTYPGVSIGPLVESVTLTNVRSGNFSSGLLHQQADGIYVDAAFAGTLALNGVNVSNPGAGKLGVNNLSAVDIIFNGSQPAGQGYNPPNSEKFDFFTAANIPAGVTRYLGSTGLQAVESDTYYVVGVTGTCYEMRMQCTLAPGAGQSNTYTIRNTLGDTLFTGVIAGAGVFEVVVRAPLGVVLTKGQFLTVKVVTSAGATISPHRGYLITSK